MAGIDDNTRAGRRGLWFGMLAILLLHAGPTWGQHPLPLEPADTSSPRGTLQSFRQAGQEIFDILIKDEGSKAKTRAEARPAIKRLAGCLNMSETPGFLRQSTAAEAAVCLLEIFDRLDMPALEKVPGPAQLKDADGKLISKYRIPHTDIEIVRMEKGPRKGEYLFSAKTVAEAAENFELVKHLPYKNEDTALVGFREWFLSEPGLPALCYIVFDLPDWTRQRLFGQAVWQWVMLALTIGLGLLLMILLYRLGFRLNERTKEARPIQQLATLIFPVLALTIPVAIRYIVTRYLAVYGMASAVVRFSMAVVCLIGIIVLLFSLGNRVAQILITSPKIHPQGIDAQFIRIITRMSTLVLAVLVFLEGGTYLGIPLTTLLAGAGIGGLTFALAAQDTIRHFFGSIMILLDKPFRVGDRIVVKGYDGVVQEIGLRSTKIRLLTGHEATIPNDDMARSDIENVARRPHIRRVSNIALPLNLSPALTDKALSIVRELLENHQGMDTAFPPRVFLDDIQRDCLNIRMMYWYSPPDYWEFMAFSEEINLQIKKRFAEADIPFALPTHSTLMASDDAHPVTMRLVEKPEDA